MMGEHPAVEPAHLHTQLRIWNLPPAIPLVLGPGTRRDFRSNPVRYHNLSFVTFCPIVLCKLHVETKRVNEKGGKQRGDLT
jgi:hypothetical protein